MTHFPHNLHLGASRTRPHLLPWGRGKEHDQDADGRRKDIHRRGRVAVGLCHRCLHVQETHVAQETPGESRQELKESWGLGDTQSHVK